MTIVGRPLCETLAKIKIGKKKIQRGLSSAVTIFVFYIFIFAFFALFIPLIIQQVEILSAIKPEDVLKTIRPVLQNIDDEFGELGIILHSEESLRNYLIEILNKIFDSSFLDSLLNVASKIGNLATALFSASFMAFFFLKDPELLITSFFRLIPSNYQTQFNDLLEDVRIILQKYFIALIIQTSCVTFLSVLFLSIIGVKNALLIGFICGALNIIPYIGPLISNVLSLIIILSTHIYHDFYTFIFPLQIKAFAALLIVQFIDNIILQPIIFSNTLKSHPLEIFIVTLAAARVAGIPGMIVAIPAYTILRILSKELLKYLKNNPVPNRVASPPSDENVNKSDTL
jgi:predicted PurR-regulated permease PerM